MPRRYYVECPNCGQTTLSLTPLDSTQCSKCHHTLPLDKKYFIIPELGFSTDKNIVRSKTTRPRKTYAGEIKYIGGGIEEEHNFEYKNKLKIHSFNNDQLLVLNEHNFFYCSLCGYTKIKDDNAAKVYTERNFHFDALGYQCANKRLEKVALGHIFKTDVIKIELRELFTKEELITTLYALLSGMSNALQIERNDINGLVVKNQNQQYELVLYDNVPGGAGHVKRLVDEKLFSKVLKESLNIVNQDCCDEESTCNSCLRNYYNQAHHRIMKKKYAKKVILSLLKD